MGHALEQRKSRLPAVSDFYHDTTVAKGQAQMGGCELDAMDSTKTYCYLE